MTIIASDQATIPIEIYDVLLSKFAAKARPRAVPVNFLAVPRTAIAQEPPGIKAVGPYLIRDVGKPPDFALEMTGT